MGGPIGLDHRKWYSSTCGQLNAVLDRPLTDDAGRLSWLGFRFRATARWRGLPCNSDEWIERATERILVCGRQVDLVGISIKRELNGTTGAVIEDGSVEIVDDLDSDFPHDYSTPQA